ncbi:hypothetical protein NDU88_002014 [Pleurodeles waltl]|uniref:Uncharacterized protein n=1 Tax=Pleurodeles waltl TaxID=8319 RepID=A0AAV7MND2_PLEWA|nr:hypothetical protein NDU88_002014 [Pleurodeles waltl]
MLASTTINRTRSVSRSPIRASVRGTFNKGREGQALALPPLNSAHCVLERRSRVGSRTGPSIWCRHPPLPNVPRGCAARRAPPASQSRRWGLEMPNEGRGGRALSLPPLCSARNALGRRPRSPPMAATPIWERRVLRGGRALRGALPLVLLFMPGNDRAVIPGALDHSRAQDFGITVGRERSSAIKLPLRPPSWPRPPGRA